jgi:hypothetical protein
MSGRVRRVDGVLGILLERHVVVDQVGLVGVDVPGGRPGDLTQQAGAGQRMVEIADLPVEDVRVGVLTLELVDQVGVVVRSAEHIIRTPARMASIGSSLS